MIVAVSVDAPICPAVTTIDDGGFVADPFGAGLGALNVTSGLPSAHVIAGGALGFGDTVTLATAFAKPLPNATPFVATSSGAGNATSTGAGVGSVASFARRFFDAEETTAPCSAPVQTILNAGAAAGDVGATDGAIVGAWVGTAVDGGPLPPPPEQAAKLIAHASTTKIEREYLTR